MDVPVCVECKCSFLKVRRQKDIRTYVSDLRVKLHSHRLYDTLKHCKFNM